MTNVATLSDAALVNELNNVAEALNEGLNDCYAEVMSERAAFGDSGPDTQKHVDAYHAATDRLNELRKEWVKRHPVVPVTISVDDEDEIPF